MPTFGSNPAAADGFDQLDEQEHGLDTVLKLLPFRINVQKFTVRNEFKGRDRRKHGKINQNFLF